MTHRVVITGMGGMCPIGSDWSSVREKLLKMESGVQIMPEFDEVKGMRTRLGAIISDFEKPANYTRKKTRTMGRVCLLATRSAEIALEQAGLLNHEMLTDGSTGVAYGSTNGSPPAFIEYIEKVGCKKDLNEVMGSTYIQFMSHTCAANLGQFFKTKGRIIPSTSACSSGSQGIGFAYESIKYGLQKAMICGGAEEMHYTTVALFSIMFATSMKNDTPDLTPSPFDRDRDGLVVGEGAATLILESLESAQERGAEILAEIVGFSTTGDGHHMVNPSQDGMERVMSQALADAKLSPDEIDYVNAHGTATEVGDIVESKATEACFQRKVPISSLKSYMGHTMGACGAIEAWICVNALNEGWIPPTLNLKNVDPQCGDLDYVTEIREKDMNYIMSNNFAFGGVNTSLILKKWTE